MSDPDSVTPPPSDEALLTNALAGDQRAWSALVERLDPYLSKVVRRRAGDLPDDIQEEIKQEVWAAVARRGPRPSSAPAEWAKDYLRHFLRPAIDSVRSSYRAPGTRARRRNEATGYDAPELVSIDSQHELEDEASAVRAEQLDTRLEVEALLALAPPVVALAATLMLNGYSVTMAALATGLQRLALHRALRALGSRRAA